jgi:DNA-binding NtrC family response regulator
VQDGEVRRVGETRAFAVDARIICATHRDLGEQVRSGSFREDLFYRLRVLTLRVPPLLERREDILPLAERFVLDEGRHARFSRAAVQALESHAWPGNVRELANAVKHGLALADGLVIDREHLPEELEGPPRGRFGERAHAALARRGGARARPQGRRGVRRLADRGGRDPRHRSHDALAQAPLVLSRPIESRAATDHPNDPGRGYRPWEADPPCPRSRTTPRTPIASSSSAPPTRS